MAAIVVYYYEILYVRIITNNFKHKNVIKTHYLHVSQSKFN